MGKPATPVDLPGILLAGLAGIGFGIVLGPEAPLLALGPALAMMTVALVRRDMPPRVLQIVGAAGAFAEVSFLLVSPLIAAPLRPLRHLPAYGHPTIGQFGWTIAPALSVALIARLIIRGGFAIHRIAAPRPLLVLPIVGLVVAGLAILFSQAEGHSVNDVLFSG